VRCEQALTPRPENVKQKFTPETGFFSLTGKKALTENACVTMLMLSFIGLNEHPS